MILNFLILFPVAIATVLFILQGRNNAILYSKLGDKAFTWNEHRIFVKEILYIFAIYVTAWLSGAAHGLRTDYFLADTVTVGIYCLIGRSFWHNGSYWITFSKIFGYIPKDKGWITHRITSPTNSQAWTGYRKRGTATYNYEFGSRLWFFIFSLVFIACNIIYKFNQ